MLNEFRRDLVSGDWVLFATGRVKGHIQPKERFYQPTDGCPFDYLSADSEPKPVLVFNDGKIINDFKSGEPWTTMVVPNKFPAVKPGVGEPIASNGPFQIAKAFGYHELVITRDHEKLLADMSSPEIAEVLMAFRQRFINISQDSCGEYVSLFHNYGPTAGATIYHNHSQIISTPIVPPEVLASINGAEAYHRQHGQRIHETIIEWERSQARRIVYENDSFIVFCPFVSKTPYEARIFPKVANPHFETITDADLVLLADALRTILVKIKKGLGDPDYNFYIHTAPSGKNTKANYNFYHWHMEIVPRVSVFGGQELGTNLFINVVDPDDAAQLFRDTVI
jgi:UDPglucose--hexose-1-phosphate uridylyltransferase